MKGKSLRGKMGTGTWDGTFNGPLGFARAVVRVSVTLRNGIEPSPPLCRAHDIGNILKRESTICIHEFAVIFAPFLIITI
jgi:hypothetical protein